MSCRMACLVFGCFLVFAAPISSKAQTPNGGERGMIRLFLDCQSMHCDMDFFRREINFVDFVRDREDADVHVLGVSQRSGSGNIYTLTFIGLRDFDSVSARYDVAVSDTDTRDEIRTRISRLLTMGLMQFVARTPEAERIRISYEAPKSTEIADQNLEKADPWNFWVFRIGGDGRISGESRQKFFNFSGSVRANRTTDDWKISLGASASRNVSDFTFSDGSTLKSTQEDYEWNGLVARALSPQWSFGLVAGVNSSTYSNTDVSVWAVPTIEFNAFPYSESSRRALTFTYGIGVEWVRYNEITIYDRTEETHLAHLVSVNLSQNQPWGSTSLELSGAQFLNDLAKYHIGLDGNIRVRLVRGLDFNIRGSISRIRDQLSLPRGGATDDEVLLRRQQLETNYRYFSSFGLSYRFGSIFNNVVNSRFRHANPGG